MKNHDPTTPANKVRSWDERKSCLQNCIDEKMRIADRNEITKESEVCTAGTKDCWSLNVAQVVLEGLLTHFSVFFNFFLTTTMFCYSFRLFTVDKGDSTHLSNIPPGVRISRQRKLLRTSTKERKCDANSLSAQVGKLTEMRRWIFCATFTFWLVFASGQSCDSKEIFVIKRICWADELGESTKTSIEDAVFILYSVNPVEGFNLRRDVYLRMATFLKQLRQVEGFSNAHLVLPAFHHLYHWKSNFRQSNMFWNHFFDLESLKRYTEILDMWEFFSILQSHGKHQVEIDQVFRLQHFEEMFENGVFVDKFEVS